jgi:hypothetical protein
MEQGFIVLKAPPGAVPSDVWTSTGRRVRPDAHGRITVAPGEAAALTNYGWSVVPPAPPVTPRWRPPPAAT